MRGEGLHIDLGRDSLATAMLCGAAPGRGMGTVERGKEKASSKNKTKTKPTSLNLHCFRFDIRVSTKFPAPAKRELESWIFKVKNSQKKVLSLLMKSEVLLQS